jgi:hypothetical protein
MYMEWFGFWVNKEQMKKEIDRLARERLQDLGKQIGVSSSQGSANADVRVTP